MAAESRTTSRATSRTRSRSRPRSSTDLARYYSASHFNDASIYHNNHELEPEERLPMDETPLEPEQPSQLEPVETRSTASTVDVDPEGGSKKEHFDDPESRRADSTSNDVLEKDVEQGAPLEKRVTTRDPNLVTWDGPDDPANPKNWSFKTKWAATFIVSAFTFISPVSSSLIAPALPNISKQFGITSDIESQLTLSIFILGYAIAPLIIGPLSEVYGRVLVLQLANLFFLAWNIGCGFAQNKGQLIAFRFLAGLGGSAPLAIGGGVLADTWRPDERGRAVGVYSLAPLLGPAVGPIAGGFIAETVTWRWCFWATSIATVVVQIFGLFFLRETWAPKILQDKMKRLQKESGNEGLYVEFDKDHLSLRKKLAVSLVRPFIMLGTQPIVQVMALYMAYIYGLLYLVLSTFPTLWTDVYHESVGIGSLNYISLGLGFFLGAQISAPLNDVVYRRLKKRNNGIGKPEFRVPLIVPSAILLPIGLFWYGWSAQAKVHWIMPNIGACIFGSGCIVGFLMLQTYIIDAYTQFAASAIGAASAMRSLAGFGFPLFAPYMYRALHYGWGNSLLGFVAIGIGLPAPFMLWFYGERLRARSKYAAG